MPSPTPLPTGPGQESVWDFPRPPRLERTSKRIVIVCNGQTILDTTGAYRVLETSHPPTYYLPPGDFKPGVLVPTRGGSVCEWKGQAAYFDIRVDDRVVSQVAWAYPRPTPPFLAIRDYVACYAGPMDAVTVDGVRVTPQPGNFYGGWITPDIVGPFKGDPGTSFW
jgi:uncharacterized protein (DUF427 family)